MQSFFLFLKNSQKK